MKNAAEPKNDSAALPAYKVRTSKRARRIGLRVLPGRGLEVVLPQHVDASCVPEVLSRYRGWISRALERMAQQPGAFVAEPGAEVVPALPASFCIKGGTEEIVLAPEAATAKLSSLGRAALCGTSLTNPPKVRYVPLFQGQGGKDRTASNAFGDLREWVREEARAYLGAMLARLAGEHGFVYAGLSVRFQRTRWGSCSAKGNISLNACLLFLPEALARYILLHELCHTRQLNHSERYWKLLFSMEPEALAQDKAMRRAWRHVPAWVFSG